MLKTTPETKTTSKKFCTQTAWDLSFRNLNNIRGHKEKNKIT